MFFHCLASHHDGRLLHLVDLRKVFLVQDPHQGLLQVEGDQDRLHEVDDQKDYVGRDDLAVVADKLEKDPGDDGDIHDDDEAESGSEHLAEDPRRFLVAQKEGGLEQEDIGGVEDLVGEERDEEHEDRGRGGQGAAEVDHVEGEAHFEEGLGEDHGEEGDEDVDLAASGDGDGVVGQGDQVDDAVDEEREPDPGEKVAVVEVPDDVVDRDGQEDEVDDQLEGYEFESKLELPLQHGEATLLPRQQLGWQSAGRPVRSLRLLQREREENNQYCSIDVIKRREEELIPPALHNRKQ